MNARTHAGVAMCAVGVAAALTKRKRSASRPPPDVDDQDDKDKASTDVSGASSVTPARKKSKASHKIIKVRGASTRYTMTSVDSCLQ